MNVDGATSLQRNVPAAVLTEQVAVASGYNHACALSSSGGVTCWGDDYAGKTHVPAAALSGQVAVIAGWSHTCSLSAAGNVTCWGALAYGSSPPANESVPALARHGVALPCVPTLPPLPTPSPLPSTCASASQAGVRTLSGAYGHVCVIEATTRGVVCWGDDSCVESLIPASATYGQAAVAAGQCFTCAMSSAGGVACWGTCATNVPAAALTGQIAISAAYYHACSLSATGGVTCWGCSNGYGQVNVPDAALADQVAIATGFYHSCSLSTVGAVTCWGDHSAWVEASSYILPSAGVVAIAAGHQSTCMLAVNGTFRRHRPEQRSSGAAEQHSCRQCLWPGVGNIGLAACVCAIYCRRGRLLG